MSAPETPAVTPGQAAYEARLAARAKRLGHAYGIGQFHKPWDKLSEADQADEEAGAQAGIAARQPQPAPGLPFCGDAEPVMAPAVARPSFGSTLVLAIHPDQDDETARKGEEAIRAATAGEGVTVVTVRGVEALRTWEPPAAPQPAPELAETLDVRNLLDVATTVTLARARQFLPAPLVAQLHRIREQGALPSLEGK